MNRSFFLIGNGSATPFCKHKKGFTGRRSTFYGIVILSAVVVIMIAVPGFGQVVTLSDPSPQRTGWFGWEGASVGDIDNDGRQDIAVSAFFHTVGGQFGIGQVFVFSGVDGFHLLTLDDPDPNGIAWFGWSVASIGDIDEDTIPDIAVGATQKEVNGNGAQGQVSVFSGADGTLLLTLDNPDPQAGAQLGVDVAGVGDVDNDGWPDIGVGAYQQTVGGNDNQGQAFVFSGADGTQLLTLDDPIPQVGAGFGITVAGVGDVNGDGRPDVAVGAFGQDVGENKNQGQAFVFSGADGTPLLTLDNPAPQGTAWFGAALAGVGDVNGDGRPDIGVGAQSQDVGDNVDQGQAFVFSGADGTRLLTLDDPDPQPDDPSGGPAQFGMYLAGVGDLDGDGRPDIGVGAYGKDVNGNVDQGQAVVFSGVDGTPLLTLDDPTPGASNYFGLFVVGMGDVNGDGYLDIASGDPLQDVGGNTQQGQAYIFHLSDLDGDTWSFPEDCVDSDPAINPEAIEDCIDGVDNDCDDQIDLLDTDCGNAPAGSNVEVTPVDLGTGQGSADVSLTFESVNSPGSTTTVYEADCGSEPWGYQLGDPPTCFDLTTTAAYSGSIDVCVYYGNMSGIDEGNLALFHEEGSLLIDITTSLDTTNDVICGQVSDLSLFLILEYDVTPIIIDIKPGSDPNCFNNDGKGVIPVGILGSDDLDVYNIAVESLMLEGMTIRVVGRGSRALANYEDINGDGFMDLIVQIEDQDGAFAEGVGTVSLRGQLLDGTYVEGTDSICIVP